MTTNIQHVTPLQWPANVPRVKYPRKTKNWRTVYTYHKHLVDFLNHRPFTNVVLTTDVELELGVAGYLLREPKTEGEDRGIALYLDYKGSRYCFTMDSKASINANFVDLKNLLRTLFDYHQDPSILTRLLKGFEVKPSDA